MRSHDKKNKDVNSKLTYDHYKDFKQMVIKSIDMAIERNKRKYLRRMYRINALLCMNPILAISSYLWHYG